MKLSVIIITYNEEINIRECLESVKWVDEIIIVDSFSKDKTPLIASEYGAKIFQLKWQGYAKQKEYAKNQASYDWILWIDADERVTKELREEIQNVLKNQTSDICGYRLPRKAYFLGKWIKHSGWYPNYVLRLFRKDKSRFEEKLVHEYVIVEGKIGKLNSPLLHYTDYTLEQYLNKLCMYTTLASEELQREKRQFTLRDLILSPIFIFLKMYVLKRGFLDGIHGFILAILSSFYVFVKYAKLWEKTKKLK